MRTNVWIRGQVVSGVRILIVVLIDCIGNDHQRWNKRGGHA